MNAYNIYGYLIYLPITLYITFYVGRVCYVNGEIYLHKIFTHHAHYVKPVNAMLLVGYYLINMGFATMAIQFWPNIHSAIGLIETISVKLGQIILLLGLLHFNNIFLTNYISKKFNL